MRKEYLRDKKLEKQIRGAILRFEKTFESEETGKEKTTRFFHIKYKFMSGGYGLSSIMHYKVRVLKLGMELSIQHYLGNPYFDRSKGWTMEIEKQ